MAYILESNRKMKKRKFKIVFGLFLINFSLWVIEYVNYLIDDRNWYYIPLMLTLIITIFLPSIFYFVWHALNLNQK